MKCGNMSSSVTTDELKRLLESGFHITEISHQMKEGKLTTTVKLLNGSNNQAISSENDSIFFDYVQHFKRGSDGYGNYVFLYSDNLPHGNNAPPTNPPLRSVYVKIGDRILTNDIIVTLVQSPGPGVPSAKAIFFIKPSSNEEFESIDTRDPLTIYDNTTHQAIYKGLINRITHGDDIANFECETAPRSLTTEQVNLEFIQFDPFDSLYFITKKTELKFQAPPQVKINLTERDFVVIVPIKHLILEGVFQFAGVEFRSIFDTKDDQIIRKSRMCQREPDWGSNFLRARVVVKSTNHFDALKSGYSKIQRAINWMVFRNDLTFTVINEGNQKIFSTYDFFKHYSRINISPMAYCREINRESACIFDTRELLGNFLVIQSDPSEYFKPTKNLFEKIFVKEYSSLTQFEKNVLLALHWVSRTVGEGNNIDRLLDLWTAIELVVLRSAQHKHFNDLEIKLIQKKLQSLNFSGKKSEIIKDKINMLNDPPIMEVFSATTEELRISLSINEWKLLKTTRNKRNDIIHGKKEWEVTNEEIEKLRGIIEKILVAVVDNL